MKVLVNDVAPGNRILRRNQFWDHNVSFIFTVFAAIGMLALLSPAAFSQVYGQPQYQVPAQNNYNDQSGVKQEIARIEIKVVRDGQMLPISQVPRIKKGDILKVRLLDEPVGGVKLDQTAWDWTLVVAYANPIVNKQKEETVTAEVQFRKQGWYKEYSFVVPFDSQPVFFLSPRAKYRDQILKAMSKNFNELQKIGEKMVEISGAYAQISSFLNELQTVVNRNQYGVSGQYNSYNPYGTQQVYNPYGGGTYNNGAYPATPYGYNQTNGGYNQPGTYYQDPYWLDQAVERLTKSFNIQMPGCWYANGGNGSGNGSPYNNGYNYGGGNTYGGSGGYSGGGNSYGSAGFNKQDFVARSQCVAKNVRLQDFEISVTRMWQQGGIFLAAELQKKYPQLAFYISIAAAAIDFIVKVFQKSPLRIVPTMLVSSDNAAAYQNGTGGTVSNGYPNTGYTYQTNFQAGNALPPVGSAPTAAAATKFSVFSTTPPSDQGFLTAYPIVVQKWQEQADPEIIQINTPSLGESCLHTGINLLKNTDLTDDWSSDSFTRDFKLLVTSDNGFKKEFPLRKNLGLGGWELNLSAQDAAQIPKVAMSLEGQITGMRGFSRVTSSTFKVPVATDSRWEIIAETQKDFAVGGKKRVALRNLSGDCLCIQSVTYKPGFGGQFTFERGSDKNSLQTSVDGRSVWFEVETSNFNSGQGTLEVKTFGGESSNLNIKLYPAPPVIRDVRVSRGDRQMLVSGERLDQLRFVIINGFRATVQPNVFPPDDHNPQITTKLLAFDDPRVRQTGSAVSLEVGLEDDRRFLYPQSFPILPSRPAALVDENNEIEGVSDAELAIKENLPVVKAARKPSANSSAADEQAQLAVSVAGTGSLGSQLISSHTAVFPITTKKVTVNIRNILSDYDFKNESLSIETRIEKSQTTANDLIKPSFEVLDWKAMRINFYLIGDIYTSLGGRRIQFRIRDKERGDSDWYTVKQTFIRVPEVAAIKCTTEMNGMCEMKGEGMDYVGAVSIDGGKNWYQGESAGLQAQPTADGQSAVMIPLLVNKKLLRLKLRDFPQTGGLLAGNFVFSSTVKNVAISNTRPESPLKSAEKASEMNGGAAVNRENSSPQNTQTVNAATNPNTSSPATEIVSLPRPNMAPGQDGKLPVTQQPPTQVVYPGSVQMMDEIIEPSKPVKP